MDLINYMDLYGIYIFIFLVVILIILWKVYDSRIKSVNQSPINFYLLNKSNGEVDGEEVIDTIKFTTLFEKFRYNLTIILIYLILIISSIIVFLNNTSSLNSKTIINNSIAIFIYIPIITIFFIVKYLNLEFKIKFTQNNVICYLPYFTYLKIITQDLGYTLKGKMFKNIYFYFNYNGIKYFEINNNNNLKFILSNDQDLKIYHLSSLEISKIREILLLKGVKEQTN